MIYAGCPSFFGFGIAGRSYANIPASTVANGSPRSLTWEYAVLNWLFLQMMGLFVGVRVRQEPYHSGSKFEKLANEMLRSHIPSNSRHVESLEQAAMASSVD